MSDLKFCCDCECNKQDTSSNTCHRKGFFNAVTGEPWVFSAETERIGLEEPGAVTWKSGDPEYKPCGRDGVYFEPKEE